MHDLAPCHNSKSSRTILERKGTSVLDWPGNSPDMKSHRERLKYNKESDW